MVRAGDDDVYVTRDAAWDLDGTDGGDPDTDETGAGGTDADDSDVADRDEPDRHDQHDQHDDESNTGDDGVIDEHEQVGERPAADTTTADAAPAALPAATTASTTTKPVRSGPRGGRPAGRGRATRPQGTATAPASRPVDATGTVPPGRADTVAPQQADTVGPEQTDTTPPGARTPTDGRSAAAPNKKRASRPVTTKRAGSAPQQPVVLQASGLVKRYGQTLAVDGIDLEIRKGSIFGVVGPNGAGKTTTLSMVTGLLRPDQGTVEVLEHDVWADPAAAKRSMGVLPDRLRLFDRLTGAQMLFYSATLRGLDGRTARTRSAELASALGLGDALGRQVADYSVGMAKKIALAATLIHAPRVLVLDEPFESVDPVSATTITEILRRYTEGGGTVVLSSHSMELVQRTCDSVAIIVGGKVLAAGTMAAVRGRKSLEDKFVELAGGRVVAESMEWLHSFSA